METVVRVALVYAFLMIAFRMIGKREFGQLEPFELVTLLLIPHLVADAMVGEDRSMTTALIGVSTLLSLVFLTSLAAYLNRRFAKVVEGEPAVIVRHGFLVPDNMNRERVPPQELATEMHKAGFERMEQVKWAILEPDGKIAFIPWSEGEPRERQQQRERHGGKEIA